MQNVTHRTPDDIEVRSASGPKTTSSGDAGDKNLGRLLDVGANQVAGGQGHGRSVEGDQLRYEVHRADGSRHGDWLADGRAGLEEMHEAHDWGEQQTAIRRQRQRDIGGLEAKGEQGEVVGWRAKAFEFDTFVEIWA
jgi:hypothetical protein